MSQSIQSVSFHAVTPSVLHAEGPHWDPCTQNLYFVDTFNATIYKWNTLTNNVKSYKIAERDSVGVIIPIAKQKDAFLVTADRYLYKVTWKENRAEIEYINMVDKDKSNNQFNDGKADYKGRPWLGTLSRNKDLTVALKGGSLFMFTGKDLENVTEQITHTTISNGLGWSPDRKKFYFIDSFNRQVESYDNDEHYGHISNKKIIFDLKDYPDIKGIPDGMTVDRKGNLWIALFGGHHVLNVDPHTGSLIRKVKMPVTYITSVCFGGPFLDILYVTTSKLHLEATQRLQEPLAGSVFAVKNLGVRGQYPNKVLLR